MIPSFLTGTFWQMCVDPDQTAPRVVRSGSLLFATPSVSLSGMTVIEPYSLCFIVFSANILGV